MTVNVACGVSNKNIYILYLEYMLIYTSKYIPKKVFCNMCNKASKNVLFYEYVHEKIYIFYP